MQKVSLALVAAFVAAIIAGADVGAAGDEGEHEVPGVVFVDGERARIDPDYRVQLGQATDDGTCVPDDAIHVRMRTLVDDEPADGPSVVAHHVAAIDFEPTEMPCVFDVEISDYEGLDALLLLAADGATPQAGDDIL